MAKHEGREVTLLLNQLIHSNGVADPTKGATVAEIFGGEGVLTIYKSQAKPLTFPRGASPPYNLTPLFQGQMPGASFMPPTGMTPGEDVAPTFAVVQISKIADVPAPPGGGEGEFVLTLERAKERGKELASAGPFKMEPQGKDLRQVQNCNAKLAAKATLDDLSQGALELRVAVYYQAAGVKRQRIAATSPLTVSWKPAPTQYVEILNGPTPDTTTPFGGLHLAHRFADEQEMKRPMVGGPEPSVKGSAPPPGAAGDINGKSGKFKRGSEDAVIESAALAVEAQNRALLQRIKIAEPKSQDSSGHVWETPSGYRDWTNLDAVFSTMGPNYVAQSDEIGTNVCRVYEEDTSVWKELTQKEAPIGLGRPMSKQEEANLKGLVGTIYPHDPTLVKSTLRPVICKDVAEIKRSTLNDAARKPICRIKVWTARNLRTKTGFLHGEAHPRVIIEIPNKPSAKWVSKAAPDNMNIEWNEEGVIPDYSYGDDLKITVVDKEWIGFEDHLGEARLMGSDFYPSEWRAELPLFNAGQKGVKQGQGPQPKLLLEVRVESPEGKASAWPPEPAIYAPAANLNVSDQETQRLANWDVTQCAKLPFADVNPNYQMNEDIWGALADGKSIQEGMLLEKPPGWRQPRVKDACLMA